MEIENFRLFCGIFADYFSYDGKSGYFCLFAHLGKCVLRHYKGMEGRFCVYFCCFINLVLPFLFSQRVLKSVFITKYVAPNIDTPNFVKKNT